MTKITPDVNTDADNLLQILLRGDLTIMDCLSNYKFVLQQNPFMRELRKSFEKKFADICRRLNVSESDHKGIIEKELYRCLCLLPLASIKQGSIYNIPILGNDGRTWDLVPYKVSLIELTPTSGLNGLFITEGDRLFACGLVPAFSQLEEGQGLKRILIFPDPYPLQQGYLASLYMQFGFAKSYQDEVNRWLEETSPQDVDKKNTTIYSSGEAHHFALHTTCDEIALKHIQRVSIVDAGSRISHVSYNCFDQQIGVAETIDIQMRKNHCYLGVKFHGLEAIDGGEQSRLKVRLHDLVTSNIFYGMVNIFFMVPIQYILMPLIRFIFQQKIAAMSILFVAIVFVISPSLISSLISLLTTTEIGIAFTVLTAFFTAAVAANSCMPVFAGKPPASCNSPDPDELQENINILHNRFFELSRTLETTRGVEPTTTTDNNVDGRQVQVSLKQ